jgi:hypothetical protein
MLGGPPGRLSWALEIHTTGFFPRALWHRLIDEAGLQLIDLAIPDPMRVNMRFCGAQAGEVAVDAHGTPVEGATPRPREGTASLDARIVAEM